MSSPRSVPTIDIGPLREGSPDRSRVAEEIDRACRDVGFFCITNHGVPPELQEQLERLSRAYFLRPLEEKMQLAMERGGSAWRGYFPVGGELTAGKPDLKEGLYFGTELGPDHPEVAAGTPLHGANLFPDDEFRATVLEYMARMTELGHVLMQGLSLALRLPEDYFAEHYTQDPFVLFRIFNYPAPEAGEATGWGVGEHTDYGVLTLLAQDDRGGLEVRSQTQWIEVPPIPGAFVCNIGDMLEKMTGGVYRSTAHRVRNRSGRARLSMPFFFDPNFRAQIVAVQGTYGDYLLAKVAKVFPRLGEKVLRR